MQLDIISYHDVLDSSNQPAHRSLVSALLDKGIVGISHVPTFAEKSRAYVNAARQFAALPEEVKKQYTPDRDAGVTEGYELGAEKFKDDNGSWVVEDKKVSYYAYVPDDVRNTWPREVDLQTPYLDLGQLIFATGKVVLNVIEANASFNLPHHLVAGYGRMLHYLKEGEMTNANPNWCGAHFDHGLFTGLMPAYYFCDGKEVDEPEEAGLFVAARSDGHFEKVYVPEKSIMLFQVGEFGQLHSDDRIRATKHMVKKAYNGIERYAFALFNSVVDEHVIKSTSVLTQDQRYSQNQSEDGSISYGAWQKASYDRYRVM